MRVLAPFLTVVAASLSIISVLWNMNVRNRRAVAIQDDRNPSEVETQIAKYARRTVTTLVLVFISIAAVFGISVFLKSIWELF